MGRIFKFLISGEKLCQIGGIICIVSWFGVLGSLLLKNVLNAYISLLGLSIGGIIAISGVIYDIRKEN